MVESIGYQLKPLLQDHAGRHYTLTSVSSFSSFSVFTCALRATGKQAKGPYIPPALITIMLEIMFIVLYPTTTATHHLLTCMQEHPMTTQPQYHPIHTVEGCSSTIAPHWYTNKNALKCSTIKATLVYSMGHVALTQWIGTWCSTHTEATTKLFNESVRSMEKGVHLSHHPIEHWLIIPLLEVLVQKSMAYIHSWLSMVKTIWSQEQYKHNSTHLFQVGERLSQHLGKAK